MESIVSFTIKTNGKAIPDELMASVIRCNSHLLHHSTAEITFLCLPNEANDMSNLITKVFTFNTEVTIEVGYDTVNKSIFTGIVSAQSIIMNELDNLCIIITCKGKTPVIADASPNAVLELTFGENIMGIDLSANKNSTAVLPADSLYETRGKVKFQGTSQVNAGNTISINNIGDSFNKTYLATGIVHQIAEGNWTTEAHLAFKESILA